MSCWVAPQLAAELWSLPTQTVMDRVHRGEIDSIQIEGFTFVNTSGQRPTANRAPSLAVKKPLTYTPQIDSDPLPATAPTTVTPDDSPRGDRDLPPDLFSEPQIDISDWRRHRYAVARQRIGPRTPAH